MKKIIGLLIKILVFLIKILIGKTDVYELSGYKRERQSIFLKNIAKLIDYACTLPGYEVTAGEMYRPAEMQAIYWATGKTKVRHSKHQDRLAFDINLFIDGEYINDPKRFEEAFRPLAYYWHSLHPDNVCGYDWKWDYNHFQMNL